MIFPAHALTVAAGRVPGRLAQMAEIGADTAGGITRPPFSDAEADALALFIRWGREAGADLMRDAFGNVFALRGNWDAVPGVMLGSHLDTVPNGGAYDGTLGVVGALAVLEAWEHELPICAAVFRGEEATISAIGCLGSQVFTGSLSFEETVRLLHHDPAQSGPGIPVASLTMPRAYLELHIEQGRQLEAAARQLGAVTGIAGYTRWRATLRGRADHSGTARMKDRRDALTAAAEIVLAVEAAGRDQEARDTVATVGLLNVQPNAANVVPGEVSLVVDVRSPEDASTVHTIDMIMIQAAAACERRNIELIGEVSAEVHTTQFPEAMIEAVERASAQLDQDSMQLPSGAGHDAMNMATVCATGMIFVPCREGRSHTPEEYATPEACVLGTMALALASGEVGRDMPAVAGSPEGYQVKGHAHEEES